MWRGNSLSEEPASGPLYACASMREMTFSGRTLSRSELACASLALFGPLLLPKTAEATTALALDLSDLVRASYRVALVTPTRSSAAWEHQDGQRRIVTRTTVLLQDVWHA